MFADDKSIENFQQLFFEFKKYLSIDARKTEMLSTVYRMLAMALGEPVKEFTYQFRNHVIVLERFRSCVNDFLHQRSHEGIRHAVT